MDNIAPHRLYPSIFFQDFLEDWNIRDRCEKKHTSTKLDDIGTKEAVNIVALRGFCGFHKSLSEDRMFDISICLLSTFDAIEISEF